MSHKNLNKAFLWIALTLLVAGLSFTAGAYTTAHSQTTLASQIPFVGSPSTYTGPPTLELSLIHISEPWNPIRPWI